MAEKPNEQGDQVQSQQGEGQGGQQGGQGQGGQQGGQGQQGDRPEGQGQSGTRPEGEILREETPGQRQGQTAP